MRTQEKIRVMKASRNAIVLILPLLFVMTIVEGVRNNNFLNEFQLIMDMILAVFFGSILFYRIKGDNLEGKQ